MTTFLRLLCVCCVLVSPCVVGGVAGKDGVCEWKAYEYWGKTLFYHTTSLVTTWDAPKGCENIPIESYLPDHSKEDNTNNNKQQTPPSAATNKVPAKSTFALQSGISASMGVGMQYKFIEGVHKAWEAYPSHAITLTVQADISRVKSGTLNRIANQWNGPISAAILTTSFDEVIQYLSTDANMAVKNWVDVHAVIAMDKWKHYPINKMRNFSIKSARTEYIMLIDIDEDLPYSMDHHLEQLEKANPSSFHRAIFLVTSWQWAIENPPNEMPHGISELAQLFEKNHATVKHPDYTKAYQIPKLDFWNWKSSTTAREIDYTDNFEPYFIAVKSTLPLFDERFEGFGGNKAVHTLLLALEDYHFILLPRVFTWCREAPSVSAKHGVIPNPRLIGDAWWELGHAHGCDRCVPEACVLNCPWMFNSHTPAKSFAAALMPVGGVTHNAPTITIENSNNNSNNNVNNNDNNDDKNGAKQEVLATPATSTPETSSTTPTTTTPTVLAGASTPTTPNEQTTQTAITATSSSSATTATEQQTTKAAAETAAAATTSTPPATAPPATATEQQTTTANNEQTAAMPNGQTTPTTTTTTTTTTTSTTATTEQITPPPTTTPTIPTTTATTQGQQPKEPLEPGAVSIFYTPPAVVESSINAGGVTETAKHATFDKQAK